MPLVKNARKVYAESIAGNWPLGSGKATETGFRTEHHVKLRA